MPSTFSTRLRLELQATGENRSTWGVKANNDFSLIDQAIAGFRTIAMSDANMTLTALNGADDQSRSVTLQFTGTLTANRTITIPSVEKLYVIKNATTGGFDLSIQTAAAGVAYPVANGLAMLIVTDGTDVYGTATGYSVASINSRSNAQGLTLSGGGSNNSGANIELYGPSHATVPNQAFYDAVTHTFRNQAGSSRGGIFASTMEVSFGSNEGTVYFGPTANNKFLYYNGTFFNFGADLQVLANPVVHQGNLGTYFAGIGINTVGSIALASVTQSSGFTYDIVGPAATTIAGSNLRASSANAGQQLGSSGTFSGTWQCLGSARANNLSDGGCVTLWKRIA